MTTVTPPTHGLATGALTISEEAMSHYLGLRHLPRSDMQWLPGVRPTLPDPEGAILAVSTAKEILEALQSLMPRETSVGLLLSGGIDSAILAALMPPGTPCFTIIFDAPGAADESAAASTYASRWGHPHHIVRVGWDDYLRYTPALMATKQSPLHAVEVPLHVAALQARSVGIDSLLVGNGADSTFGGMDKLLTPTWTFDRFVERYSFVDPRSILLSPTPITGAFEPYRQNDGIDVQGFLRHVHGQGIVQSFDNAIRTAGLDIVAPYEAMAHDGELNIERIRAGEPKYLLQELYRDLYSTAAAPEKIPFARPMDVWMKEWPGSDGHAHFRDDIAHQLTSMSGEQRFLVWCLDRFLQQLEHHA